MYHVICNSLDRKGRCTFIEVQRATKLPELQNVWLWITYPSFCQHYPMLRSTSLPTTVIAQEDEDEDDEDEEAGDMDEEGTDTTVPQMFQY